MRKAGLFKIGYQGGLSWSWKDTGEPNGSISYRIESDERMVLNWQYRAKYSGDDWHDTEQVICLSTSPCNYGGVRHWLHCPNCRRRGEVLYMADSGFYCRKCCRLNYQTQHEDSYGRALAKSHKLEDMLCGNNRKRMWRKTRQRLELQHMLAEEAALAGLIARCKAMGMNLGDL